MVDNIQVTVTEENPIEVSLENNGKNNFIEMFDTPITYEGAAGSALLVNATEDGVYFSAGVTLDELVKVSGSDTAGAYLGTKLVAGSNISLEINNVGSNETLSINGPDSLGSIDWGNIGGTLASQIDLQGELDLITGSVGSNTVHRTSTGVDHTYIDQDVRTTASPTFYSQEYLTLPNDLPETYSRLVYSLSSTNYVELRGAVLSNANRNEDGQFEVHMQSGGTVTKELSVNKNSVDAVTKKIVNVVDPVDAQDAATKAYVDGATGSSSWGTIGGTLSDQADLQAALDLKYDAGSLTEDIYSNGSVVANTAHRGDVTTNPHNVTGSQVGLGNVNNVEQMPLAYLDTDDTLGSNSDVRVPSQRAVKEYVNNITAGSISWGAIAGTLSDQVDLQTALDLKYDAADYNTDWDGQMAVSNTGSLTEGANLYYTEARVQANGSVVANTAKVTNANHTGDVSGSGVLTIGSGVVDLSMLSATGTPNIGTYLRGDNTWASLAGAGTVTSVVAGSGLDFTEITGAGSVALGTPSTITASTANALTDTSHTHELDESGISITAAQVSDFDAEVSDNGSVVLNTTHRGLTDNPHSVTKVQVGLSNVDDVQQMPLVYLDTDNTLGSDSDVRVPSQKAIKTYVDALVDSAIILQGDWDADTNSPDITGTTTTGYAWRVSVAGNTNLGGITSWAVNDLAVKTASSWLKVDNEDIAAVWGNISGTLSNQSDLQSVLDLKYDESAFDARFVTRDTGSLPEGSNLYYTEARVSDNGSVVANTTHRGNTSNPHNVTALQIPDLDTEITNNIDVALNSIHRTSSGVDHTYINQDVGSTADPIFNTLSLNVGSAPVHSEGMLFYDTDSKSMNYYNDKTNVTMNLGRELWTRSCNNTGSTINDGTVVYISGVDSGCPEISLAQPDRYETSRIIGVSTESISDGTQGEVTAFGLVNDIDTSGLSLGPIYLDTDGALTSTKPTETNYVVVVGECLVVNASTGQLFINPIVADTTVEVTDTNGFPSQWRSGTTISFVDGTRTFTIAPTSTHYHYYINGDNYYKDASDDVVITDVTGVHLIYFDGTTLTALANPNQGQVDSVIRTKALVAYLYWNATDGAHYYLGDERHGISMSPETHAYLHFTRGIQYLSGLAVGDIIIGNGSLNSHAQFSTASGFVTDEDLFTSLDAIASTTGLKYLYRDGASGIWKRGTNTGYSFPIGATPLPQYNEWTGATWQLSEVSSGNYMLLHIFASNDTGDEPYCVLGQAEYSTIAAASIAAEGEIGTVLSTLPIEEFLPVATVIIEGKTSFTNVVQARVVQNTGGDDYIDWRTTELQAGASAADHNNLAGLQLAASGTTWGHIDDQAQNIVGVKTFTSLPYGPVAAPTVGSELITKEYADATYIGAGGVTSFNGRTGSVVPTAGDYTAALVTNAFDKSVDTTDDITEGTFKFTTAGSITKLAGIEAGAEVNNISDVNAADLTDAGDSILHYHATDRNRGNHTGTQTASTISDFDAEVSNNTSVAANTTHRTSDGKDHSDVVLNNSYRAVGHLPLVGGELTGSLSIQQGGAITALGITDSSTNHGLSIISSAIKSTNKATLALTSTNASNTEPVMTVTNFGAGPILECNGNEIVDSDGNLVGGGGGVFKFERKLEGNVYTTTFLPIVITDAEACTIDEVRISLSALPTGADFQVDVRKNGTASTDSIFTSDVPIEIATGASATNGVYQSGCDTSSSTVGTAGTTIDSARDDVVADDVLWVVITQVGSTIAGADFNIILTGA